MTDLLKDESMNKIIDNMKKDIVETAGHRWRKDSDDSYQCIDCDMRTISITDFKLIGICAGKDQK